MDYHKIFSAHCRSRQALMLWGSSGYGKSSMVEEFARRYKLRLEVLHTQYLDPLALFIPATNEMSRQGFAKFYPSEIIHRILNSKEKTVLFLDELTRAREDTLNILTEVLLERRVFGYAIPNNIYIFAASNFAEEDAGVRELPDAVMQRMTHIVHAPDPSTALKNLKNSLAQKALQSGKNLIGRPGSYPILDRLRPSPRQIDACGLLAEAGLKGEELLEACRGRIGLEAGTELAFALLRQLEGKAMLLPQTITAKDFSTLAQLEQGGNVIEVIEFLRGQSRFQERMESIAGYLLIHAKPEVCRAMQLSGFQHQLAQLPLLASGDRLSYLNTQTNAVVPFDRAGKPWQWYAVKLGKLSSR